MDPVLIFLRPLHQFRLPTTSWRRTIVNRARRAASPGNGPGVAANLLHHGKFKYRAATRRRSWWTATGPRWNKWRPSVGKFARFGSHTSLLLLEPQVSSLLIWLFIADLVLGNNLPWQTKFFPHQLAICPWLFCLAIFELSLKRIEENTQPFRGSCYLHLHGKNFNENF